MSVTIQLEGFRELEQELQQFSRAVGKGVLRRALLDAAQPLVKAAAGMAPDDPRTGTDDLKASIVASTKLNKRQRKLHRKMFRNDKASVEIFVGTNDPAAVQQEFGNINHPPQAFMRPAWDADKAAIIPRIAAAIRVQVDKAAQRAARRAAKRARAAT